MSRVPTHRARSGQGVLRLPMAYNGVLGKLLPFKGAHARREKGSSLEVASFPVQVAGCSLTLKTAPST